MNLFPAFLLNCLLESIVVLPNRIEKGFQFPATDKMLNIIEFHNDLIIVLGFIFTFVFILLSVCLYKYARFERKIDSGVEGISRVNKSTSLEVA